MATEISTFSGMPTGLIMLQTERHPTLLEMVIAMEKKMDENEKKHDIARRKQQQMMTDLITSISTQFPNDTGLMNKSSEINDKVPKKTPRLDTEVLKISTQINENIQQTGQVSAEVKQESIEYKQDTKGLNPGGRTKAKLNLPEIVKQGLVLQTKYLRLGRKMQPTLQGRLKIQELMEKKIYSIYQLVTYKGILPKLIFRRQRQKAVIAGTVT